jgi:hypothetical protein
MSRSQSHERQVYPLDIIRASGERPEISHCTQNINKDELDAKRLRVTYKRGNRIARVLVHIEKKIKRLTERLPKQDQNNKEISILVA